MTFDVAEKWIEIAAEGRVEPGWHVRRMQAAAQTALYAALRLPGRSKGLLLEVRARSIHPSSTFPFSLGFKVDLETIDPGPNGSVRICLELTDCRYGDVFAVLADDVAKAVALSGSEKEGVVVLIGRLKTWQKFLKRHGDGMLSEQEQTGLFAELYVFRELLDRGMAASDAVAAWVGPWSGAQDFRFPNCSVEVKATASPDATSFEVANLIQLDERRLPCLLVWHLALVRTELRGQTLPDMINEIAEMISKSDAAAAIRFSDSLLEVGYSEAHRADYGREGFEVHSDKLFRVEGEFPRIYADEVRSGVAACSYSVHLAACLPFIMHAVEACRLIHGTSDDR